MNCDRGGLGQEPAVFHYNPYKTSCLFKLGPCIIFIEMKVEVMSVMWRIDWRRARMNQGNSLSGPGKRQRGWGRCGRNEVERTRCICKILGMELTRLPAGLNRGRKITSERNQI